MVFPSQPTRHDACSTRLTVDLRPFPPNCFLRTETSAIRLSQGSIGESNVMVSEGTFAEDWAGILALVLEDGGGTIAVPRLRKAEATSNTRNE